MGRFATPTKEPGGQAILPAAWGAAIGAVAGLADLIASASETGVTAIKLLPATLVLGGLLGFALWDAPRLPAWARRVAWPGVALVGAAVAFVLPGWETAAPPAWHAYMMSGGGIFVAVLGGLWFQAGRANGILLVVSGIATTILASLLHPAPVVWTLLPAWLATYAPLVVWYRTDWWLRSYGLVGNVTTIALIQNVTPDWLLGSSWAPFALAVVYVTAMVLLHLYREVPAERQAEVAWWILGLFAVATLMAAAGDLIVFAWLPTPALLPVLAVLGAIHAGAAARPRNLARWGSFGLGALCVLLGLSTLIGRIRTSDNPWESLALLVFGGFLMAAWWFLPARSGTAAAAPA